MVLGRFLLDNKVFYGLVENNIVWKINDINKMRKTDEVFNLNDLKVLSPVLPRKIICVGLNYKDHAKELNLEIPTSPTLFIKPNTTVIGPNDNIIYPHWLSSQVDYEGELAIVISNKCHRVSTDEAKKYILGYTCSNDVTARDLQPKNGQWTIAKSFDTFLPLGPFITDEINPFNLDINTYLNGKLVQSSNTKNLIFNVYELVSFISQIITLERFDVIITGTPSGIGPMQKGDIVEVEIEGIGRLKNSVK